jgi:hypothetical protein
LKTLDQRIDERIESEGGCLGKIRLPTKSTPKDSLFLPSESKPFGPTHSSVEVRKVLFWPTLDEVIENLQPFFFLDREVSKTILLFRVFSLQALWFPGFVF